MKSMVAATIGSLFLTMGACSSAPERMGKLHVGMSRDQVIDVMGDPDQTGAKETKEVLFYRYQPMGQMWKDVYFVRLTEGKVDRYGEVPRSAGDLAAQRAAALFMLQHPIYQAPPPQRLIPPAPSTNINCTTQQIGNTGFTHCN